MLKTAAYDYIDMDLLVGQEKIEVREEIEKWNPKCSFPTLVIKNEKCIVGYKVDEIKEALGI